MNCKSCNQPSQFLLDGFCANCEVIAMVVTGETPTHDDKPTLAEIWEHWLSTSPMGLPEACELVASDLQNGNEAAIPEAIELLRLFADKLRQAS